MPPSLNNPAVKEGLKKAGEWAKGEVVGVVRDEAFKNVVESGKRATEARRLRRVAHDLAWQRGGRVGKVRFTDGKQRWVVVDSEDVPILACPQFGDGSLEGLREELANVQYTRCMGPSARELKDQKRRAREQRKQEKDAAKAATEAAETEGAESRDTDAHLGRRKGVVPNRSHTTPASNTRRRG